MVGSEFLWPRRFHERLHISTRQYARLVRGLGEINRAGAERVRQQLGESDELCQ